MTAALVDFQDGGLPAPENRGRRAFIRAAAVVALLATVAYLVWRTVETVDLDVWWVSVPLLAMEVHAGVSLALFVFSLWDVDGHRPAATVTSTDARIAILIPTYNEPVEVLLPTIAAAVALEPAHETWVLDDGNRREVADLAARLGARYLTRPDRSHAKAGNVNHALGIVDVDFVALLDADHVAQPGLLTNTLGYFDDPRVALVQTPQDFYNRDSFEHEEQYSEQALFYRVLQAGKNRWKGVFWCGTNAVVRVAALREVGGVATETITEDIHTTIRMHRRGWRTVYHNEVLARGLAASSADQYTLQRLRWGTGAMQVLRTENPLFVRGLSFGQRLSYGATLFGWFESWRSLGYLLAPIAVVATGAVPIRANALVFAVVFGTTFALQRAALVLLGRGHAPQLLSTVFELVRMPANIRATLALVDPRPRRFSVTPKGRIEGGRRRVSPPSLLTVLVIASVAGIVWFGLTVAGITGLRYRVPWAAYGAAGWLVFNTGVLSVAIRRITAERFGHERRASVRFATHTEGVFDGRPCEVLDLSLTGAKIVIPSRPRRSARHHLTLDSLGVDLRTDLRTMRFVPGGVHLGLQFQRGQDEQLARLSLALLAGGTPGLLSPSETPAATAPERLALPSPTPSPVLAR